MTESKKFRLKLKQIPVCIVDANEKEKSYTMYELNGKQRDIYFNEMRERFKIVNEETQVTDFEGFQASLLAMCLKDENQRPVTQEDIQEYPSTVLTELFKMAQSLSGLGEETPKKKVELKKD